MELQQILHWLQRKEGTYELIKEICSIVDGPISAEAISLDADGMIKEARSFQR